jgi:hypothetical protein
MTAPERLTLTDADLRLLLREGCNANELAAVSQVPVIAMESRIAELTRDHARDIVGPDFDA